MKKIPVEQKNNNPEVETAEEASTSTADGQANENTVTLDQAIVEEFEKELAEARRQADEYHDKYLRAIADLENIRKRLEKTYQERVTKAKRELLLRFLEVADNLERALKAAEEGGDIVEGVKLTYRQLQQSLAQEGVEPIEAVGKPFDPMLHEAVSVVTTDQVKDETVVAEERKGYTYRGELLRPSRVHVAKKKE